MNSHFILILLIHPEQAKTRLDESETGTGFECETEE